MGAVDWRGRLTREIHDSRQLLREVLEDRVDHMLKGVACRA